MSFAPIDVALDQWVKKHKLHLYTIYRDEEVRTVDVVSARGDRYQIWFDRPKQQVLQVHAWDFKKRRADFDTTVADLPAALEAAYKTVLDWMTTT